MGHMGLSISRTRRCSQRRAAAGTGVAVIALLACVDALAAADCAFSTTGVSFGNYDPLVPTSTDATGALTVVCTHLSGGAMRVNYTVALSAGSSGSYAQRRLRAGTAILDYNLFDSAARTRIWGDGTGVSTRVTGSLLVNPGSRRVAEASHPIHGRIAALQAVATGNYSDTIVVTLTF
jgi:spore coat protein U-like protein